jgi:excisionase family DNA binding protein
MKAQTATRHDDRPEVEGGVAPPNCWRLFSIQQAADFAGVPVQQILRWIRIGKVEAYHLGGGRVRIYELDLTELLRALRSRRSPSASRS